MFIKIRLAMAKKSINKILGVDNDISKTEQWFSKIKNILKGSDEVYDDVFYDDDTFYDDDDDEEFQTVMNYIAGATYALEVSLSEISNGVILAVP